MLLGAAISVLILASRFHDYVYLFVTVYFGVIICNTFLFVLLVFVRDAERFRAAQTCLRCGYDLSNIPWQTSPTNPDEHIATCPECGIHYVKRLQPRIDFASARHTPSQ